VQSPVGLWIADRPAQPTPRQGRYYDQPVQNYRADTKRSETAECLGMALGRIRQGYGARTVRHRISPTAGRRCPPCLDERQQARSLNWLLRWTRTTRLAAGGGRLIGRVIREPVCATPPSLATLLLP
jgi:hypothetical protein